MKKLKSLALCSAILLSVSSNVNASDLETVINVEEQVITFSEV